MVLADAGCKWPRIMRRRTTVAKARNHRKWLKNVRNNRVVKEICQLFEKKLEICWRQ
jgi:hypothetical protein